MITDLSQKRSSINHYMLELRDKESQRNSYLFRQNIGLMGTLLAYEASKIMSIYFNQKMCRYPTIVNVLRAGNPFVAGVLEIFRKSRVDFYGVARDEKTLKSTIYYEKTCNYDHGILIIPDVMLATGTSLEVIIKRILDLGTPERIIILSCIAHIDGINRVGKLFNNIDFLVGAIDPGLDQKGYIVPGLGDAGDLCYGS